MANNRRDKRREKYSRNTQGWNAQGFFGEAGSLYPIDVTIQAFVYSTINEGRIGLYEDDGILKSTILLAGQKFTVNQKNSDGTIKKSTELAFGEFTVEKTLYDAPAAQKDIISPLNISIVGGLQEFVLSVRETTPANQPFPVMEGRAIVRSGTPTEYEIASHIVNDINNSYDFERNGDNNFAAVNVISDVVAAGAPLTGPLTLSSGNSQGLIVGVDDTGILTVGSFLLVDGFAPDPPTVFKIVSSSYDGVNTTVVLDRNYSSPSSSQTIAGALVTIEAPAAIDASVIGIEVVGADELTHFDTSVSEDLGDAVITTLYDWNFGSGASWQVAAIEDECAVFDGWTTLNEAWVRDFGAPDLWVDDSDDTVTYTLYFIESINRIIPSAGTPQNQTLMKANIVIAAPTGSTLESNIDTILDV